MTAQSVCSPPSKGYFGSIGSAASSVVVLAALGSLMYLGHKFHWNLLEMAALASGRHDAAQAPLDETKQSWPSGDPRAGASDPSLDEPTFGPDSTIQFRSASGVEKSGLEVSEVQRRKISRTVVAHGVIGYDQTRYAHLSAKVPGTVWRIEQKVGQQVRKGDVLTIVESFEVGKAKAEFLTAIANVEIKTKLLEILTPLTSVVAGRQIKEAEAALREAKIRLYNAHQVLVNLGLPIDIDDVKGLDESSLAKRVQFLGLPPSIANTLDRDTTTANLLPLIAPFDGVVLGRDVAIGEVVQPTQAQFVVADVDHMWIHLDVRIEDAGLIAIGQEVRYRPDGLNKEIHSTVSWISTEADEKTRTVEVRADVRNPLLETRTGGRQRLLHAHTFGLGRIQVASEQPVPVVPKTAVQYVDGQPVVFVRTSPTTFEPRAVGLGIGSDVEAEVLSGVQLGETVVTIGSQLLKAEILRKRTLAGNARS